MTENFNLLTSFIVQLAYGNTGELLLNVLLAYIDFEPHYKTGFIYQSNETTAWWLKAGFQEIFPGKKNSGQKELFY